MNKKWLKYTLSYFNVLIVLLAGIAISKPSRWEPIIIESQANEGYYEIGDEPEVYDGLDVVVIATVINVQGRHFAGEDIGIEAIYLAETISTIRIEEVLMQNDESRRYRSGNILYVRERGNTRAIYSNAYRKADFLSKGERMILFLENADNTRSAYNSHYSQGLNNYTIMRRASCGRMDRIIASDGVISEVPISPYGMYTLDYQPFTQYKTIAELRKALKSRPVYTIPANISDDTVEEREAYRKKHGEAAYNIYYNDAGWHVLQEYIRQEKEADMCVSQ